MMVNMEDPNERLPLLREESNIEETQIPFLNTTGKQFAKYLISVERVRYNGGLQSQVNGSLPLLNLVHQLGGSSY